jgi:hypothetical protein
MKHCVNRNCGLYEVNVKTDAAKCVLCEQPLQPPLSDLFNLLGL